MFINRKFIAKILLLCFIISFVFPIFTFASDDVFVWSEDLDTSIVNANISNVR